MLKDCAAQQILWPNCRTDLIWCSWTSVYRRVRSQRAFDDDVCFQCSVPV